MFISYSLIMIVLDFIIFSCHTVGLLVLVQISSNTTKSSELRCWHHSWGSSLEIRSSDVLTFLDKGISTYISEVGFSKAPCTPRHWIELLSLLGGWGGRWTKAENSCGGVTSPASSTSTHFWEILPGNVWLISRRKKSTDLLELHTVLSRL